MRELDYRKMGQRIRQARKAKGWSQGVMVEKCGSSPGVFISELFQSHYDMDGAGPFSEFAAKEDDLLAARGISELSHKEDAGGCVISLDKKACDVNGRHYTIKDDAFVQIRTKGSDIYYSLFLDAAETFAADIFADSFTGRCFIFIDAADSDRICVPLSGARLLSIEKQKLHRGGAGLIIEYDEYLESGVHGRIVCGMALDQIRRALQTGSDRYSCRQQERQRGGQNYDYKYKL